MKYIRKISKKKAKRMAEFNKNVPPANVAGIYNCENCGQTPDFRGIQRAHIIPLSRGGKDTRDNIEYLCAKCHFSKYHGIYER